MANMQTALNLKILVILRRHNLRFFRPETLITAFSAYPGCVSTKGGRPTPAALAVAASIVTCRTAHPWFHHPAALVPPTVNSITVALPRVSTPLDTCERDSSLTSNGGYCEGQRYHYFNASVAAVSSPPVDVLLQ